MKFLCPSCKAKYQIADEKVQGRTLRMRCRRCEHYIVIKPDAGPEIEGLDEPLASKKTASGIGPPPAPAGARRGSAFGNVTAPAAKQAPPRQQAGSALGADFRKQAAAAPEAPKAPSPALDAWHVAIHDVPVGPMRREEVAKKIASGAVTSESLVWREGLDDWRPLRDVPELVALMRSITVVGEPSPPAKTPSTAGTRGGSGAWSRPTPPAAQGARSNVVAIGGRMGAATAPTLDEFADEMPDEPTRVSTGLPFADEAVPDAQQQALGTPAALPMDGSAAFPALAAPVATPAAANPKSKRSLPVGAWIAVSGSVAFGIALAFVIGARLIAPPEPKTITVIERQTVVQAPQKVVTRETAPRADTTPTPESVTAESAETTTGAERVNHNKARTPTPTTPTKQTQPRQLTAEQQRLREELGQGLNSSSKIAMRNLGDDDNNNNAARGSGDLNADQIRAVVTRNSPQVQQCYETAARATGATETLRLDIDLNIGPSGTVTRVTTRGAQVGNLSRCIERVVRGWRFPPSGAGGQTSIPFILQPGGR